MNALETIKTRRSTRRFKDKPVEKELLETILEAGRYAPSGGNNQSTHLICITNKEVLDKIALLAQSSFAKMSASDITYPSLATSINASKKGNYVFHFNAPALIICANKKDYGNNMADVACCLENMMIAANALDLGSCYVNQLKWLNIDENMNQFLFDLGMENYERVYGALVVGYPDTKDALPNRMTIDRKGNKVTFIE